MRRSTFIILGVAAFALVLLTFIIRGTTRLVIGERISVLIVLPLVALSILLISTLVIVAFLAAIGYRPMVDDLETEVEREPKS